ncbi:MAG: hypothetical protein FWD58_06870 [Firmicutes bacterium]|nr:hypothetical protein [Bacillota bacterium]
METTKRKKRKTSRLFAFIMIALLICTTAGVTTFASTDKLSVDATSINDEIGFARYARYIPTLADDFADDRVIVTLKSQHSDVNRSQSFRTTGSVAIESVEDLTYIINPAEITNRETFSQIFSITLRE